MVLLLLILFKFFMFLLILLLLLLLLLKLLLMLLLKLLLMLLLLMLVVAVLEDWVMSDKLLEMNFTNCSMFQRLDKEATAKMRSRYQLWFLPYFFSINLRRLTLACFLYAP